MLITHTDLRQADTPLDETSPLRAGALSRVLVVEDNALVALDLEDMLLAQGAGHVAVATTLEAADSELGQPVTLAILDFTLGTDTTEALAGELERRGIPFLFVTGYSDAATLPVALRTRPMLVKPFDPSTLRAAIDDVIDCNRSA